MLANASALCISKFKCMQMHQPSACEYIFRARINFSVWFRVDMSSVITGHPYLCDAERKDDPVALHDDVLTPQACLEDIETGQSVPAKPVFTSHGIACNIRIACDVTDTHGNTPYHAVKYAVFGHDD